jgi:MFS family permease
VVYVADHVPESTPEHSAVDRVRLDPRLRTRDDTGLTAAVVGTLGWAVAWIVLTLAGTDGDTTDFWRWVCAIGIVIGLIVFAFLLIRLRRRRTPQE